VKSIERVRCGVTIMVLIPKVGMGSAEGTIAKWRKAEGERVTIGEIIVEIEMAKAVEEVPAPATGILTRILLGEGQTAEVFSAIAEIDDRV
jgi:pyruvate/2-oxoglutarate dehydrogenase complex dihydrolipoamide acyltransferase (E2) component